MEEHTHPHRQTLYFGDSNKPTSVEAISVGSHEVRVTHATNCDYVNRPGSRHAVQCVQRYGETE